MEQTNNFERIGNTGKENNSNKEEKREVDILDLDYDEGLPQIKFEQINREEIEDLEEEIEEIIEEEEDDFAGFIGSGNDDVDVEESLDQEEENREIKDKEVDIETVEELEERIVNLLLNINTYIESNNERIDNLKSLLLKNIKSNKDAIPPKPAINSNSKNVSSKSNFELTRKGFTYIIFAGIALLLLTFLSLRIAFHSIELSDNLREQNKEDFLAEYLNDNQVLQPIDKVNSSNLEIKILQSYLDDDYKKTEDYQQFRMKYIHSMLDTIKVSNFYYYQHPLNLKIVKRSR